MDIAQQEREDMKMLSPRLTCDIQNKSESLPQTKKSSVKRSFDVAFLMLPDDKLKQKYLEKQSRTEEEIDVTSYPTELTVKNDFNLRQHHEELSRNFQNFESKQQKIMNFNLSQEIMNNELRSLRYPPIHQSRPPRIYDDPTILSSPENHRHSFTDLEAPRSAFTKVPQSSPNPPPSPDQLSCPSNSPPISLSPPKTNSYSNQIRPEYHFINNGFQPIQHLTSSQHNKMKHQQFMYRPPVSTANTEMHYIQSNPFAFSGNGHHPFVQQQDIARSPAAAAILSTLIPPALASTFSLATQNVCAKCNISFRMTSDLVYHMRSHHKSETIGDFNRRKREDKLKCPVCNESFRERHHLTRHMTAHNDKAGDDAERVSETSRRHKH